MPYWNRHDEISTANALCYQKGLSSKQNLVIGTGISIPQTIAKTTHVYRPPIPSCFALSTPNHHQHVGYSSVYSLVQSLLEYTVNTRWL